MSSEKKIVGLVGSPNKDGRTFDLVSAALDGAGRRELKLSLSKCPIMWSMPAKIACLGFARKS